VFSHTLNLHYFRNVRDCFTRIVLTWRKSIFSHLKQPDQYWAQSPPRTFQDLSTHTQFHTRTEQQLDWHFRIHKDLRL
jgi:hypothetical protein